MSKREQASARALDNLLAWVISNRGTPHAFITCRTYPRDKPFPPEIQRAEKLLQGTAS